MADITMCSGKDCSLKESCKRFTAPKSEYNQSYFCEPPIKDGKCDMYWGAQSESIMNYLNSIVNGKS